MHVTENNPTIFFDCDDTLIMWKPSEEEITNNKLEQVMTKCNGFNAEYYVNHYQVQFLEDLACRGHTIVVWSSAGVNWALACVEALGIEDYVDTVTAKPSLYVDDKPDTSDWMGKHQYISVNGEPVRKFPRQSTKG